LCAHQPGIAPGIDRHVMDGPWVGDDHVAGSEVDVSGWMATVALAQYPDEDPIEVAVLAGIPADKARAALAEL
jgi:hypothetical protein